MDNKTLDKATEIIKIMKDLDKILCPCCNKYEKCKGSSDMECLLASAIKARKMRE